MNLLISRRLGFSAAALLLISLLSACRGAAGVGTSPTSSGSAPTATYALPTATATYTLPGAPAGWQVYHGNGFAVAYPPGWTESPQSSGSGSQGIFLDNSQITIFQITGYSAQELQESCMLANGESWVTLAGLTMKYSTPEGVHRSWFFLNKNNEGYEIEANDGFSTSTTQEVQQDDAVLATLKLDDATPGCPHWGV